MGGLALLACAAGLLGPAGCRRSSEPAGPEAALEVGAVRAVQREVPITREYVGRTAAVESVEIRARVSGYLEKALFEEGTDAQSGDLLFVIDQAPYRAALEEAEGQLEQARAVATRAEKDWQRAAALFRQGVVSAATRDAARAAVDEAKADVRTRQAAVDQAQLDLGYTEIRAPIEGRVGRIRVDVGNLIGEQTVLATLVRLDPIYVYFNPPERDRLEVLRERQAGRYVPRAEIAVRVTLSDGSEYPEPGRIDFVDNTVDPGAGTIQVRAVFRNPDKTLLPGQYAEVHVVLGRRNAVLVPERSVIEEQGSTRVLVVGENDTVESRSVVVDGSAGGLRVIESGLDPGERVLVDNLQKARPGMQVRVRDETPGVKGPPAG